MYETQEKAKRITDIHVLWGQSTVIEELIQAGKIDEEYLLSLIHICTTKKINHLQQCRWFSFCLFRSGFTVV